MRALKGKYRNHNDKIQPPTLKAAAPPLLLGGADISEVRVDIRASTSLFRPSVPCMQNLSATPSSTSAPAVQTLKSPLLPCPPVPQATHLSPRKPSAPEPSPLQQHKRLRRPARARQRHVGTDNSWQLAVKCPHYPHSKHPKDAPTHFPMLPCVKRHTKHALCDTSDTVCITLPTLLSCSSALTVGRNPSTRSIVMLPTSSRSGL